jgi:hypothetical protein
LGYGIYAHLGLCICFYETPCLGLLKVNPLVTLAVLVPSKLYSYNDLYILCACSLRQAAATPGASSMLLPINYLFDLEPTVYGKKYIEYLHR